jgi:hypothetical protein
MARVIGGKITTAKHVICSKDGEGVLRGSDPKEGSKILHAQPLTASACGT